LSIPNSLHVVRKCDLWLKAAAAVFALAFATNTWACDRGEDVLLQFGTPTVGGQPSLKDGILPFGGLIRDADGNIYGTASQGGKYGYGPPANPARSP
jgi:hypothetical protein